MDCGIAIVTADDNQNAEQRTAVHEFGHFYDIVDHNGDGTSTPQMNAETGGTLYKRYCIYGEYWQDSGVIAALTICEGCQNTIADHNDNFDHLDEGDIY